MKQSTQPELPNEPSTHCDWILPILLACLCFLPIGRALDAAVEGGAFVKGDSLSDGTLVIPEASGTSKAIKWSTADLDPSTFEFDASSPSRLKVKAAGDYFLAFTGPIIEQARTADKRSQVHFFVKKNGTTTIQAATARSTYVRHDSDHTESSGHMHLLLPSLSANDYIEIYAKCFDNATQNSVKIGTASLFLEKIASSRTIFSATATRLVAGTNLNPDTASALQWTQDIADTGFTHSNSSNSHNITLANAGKYLVFANVPLSGGVSRGSPQMIPKLDGVQVSGGFAAQGYIRNADATTKSSIHWVGLVQTNSANKVLTFDLGKRAAGGTLTVPTNEKASVFIEKLSNANNLFSARATQLSTGDNWNAAGEVKWATQETIDASKFTHSASSNAHQVAVDADGDYLLLYSDGLTSGVARANPKMVVRVNGNDISGAEVSSHYQRNASGHIHSSGALVTVLNGLKANDIITVGVSVEATSGTVNDHVAGRLVLLKKPTLPAPVITMAQTSGSSPISASVTFKQDGSNVAVTGFTASDVTVNDATIANFSGSGHTYTFNVVPTTYPAIINLTIPAGAATTGGGAQTGIGTALTQFRDLVTDDGSLVLYLPFDEGTGTVTKDRSSSGRDGTLGGNPTWVAGKRGYALEFDGTGDQVDVSNFKGIVGTGPISVALWFKSTYNNASAQQSFVSWGVNGSGTRYTLNFDGASIRLDNGGGAAKTTATYADGLWHHVVAIKPNNGNIGNVVHYVDGVVSAHGGSGSSFNISESSNFSIGADRTGANRINFIGTIDDFRLYGKELNATAVSALYASGAGEGYYTPTIPTLTVDQYANASPVPVSVTFKRGGSNLSVSGFTSSDVSVAGGTVSGFSGSGGGGHTYTFNVTPSSFPSTVTVTIPKGAGAGGGGVYANDVVSKSFQASYPASFSTSTLGDVEMWYDASDLNADGTTDSGFSSGNAVNSWSDKSGNGYHLTKAGDPSWASHNGLGVVNFDGDDAYYSDNEWGGGGEFTIFSISRYTHATNNFRVISDRAHNWFFGYHSGHMNKWHFNGWLTDNANGKDTKFHLHVASMNASDQGNTFYDGSRVGSVNGNGSHNSNYLPRKLQFGGYSTNSEFSKCE
ncbi:MAG: Ig-like domain-containing protein, partial [Verrucomicrobiota bacterium]|nr:Ig-like domain-containing protein [Verrucomicrobiota bacterium]